MVSSALPHLNRRPLLWLAALLLFLTRPGLTQGRGTIFGTVTDANGAAMQKAQLTLTETATQQKRFAASSEGGDYSFPALTPGSYSLSVTAPGFTTFIAQSITLQVDENRQIAVKLNLGEVTQQVTVSDQTAPQIETRTSTISEVVDSERVKELPLNGRNALQLQYLVAGAGAVFGGRRRPGRK